MRAEIKPKVGYIAFASNIAKSLDFDTAVKIPTGVCCHSYARLLVYRNVRAIYAKVEDSNRCESIVERLRELIENCIDGMAIWFFAASPINHSMSATILLIIGDDLHLAMTKDQIDTDRRRCHCWTEPEILEAAIWIWSLNRSSVVS